MNLSSFFQVPPPPAPDRMGMIIILTIMVTGLMLCLFAYLKQKKHTKKTAHE